ncbi:hypothetical protein NDU88_006667 [Pleurodeles waltl]|uniref:Uncharacterized protein n=1 Tax=Pleurodeles waltl TaxID=8319 RepID=A0AAV7NQV7_PLEWA|nr:hypothetical protein NDU88_006667 [Pleurodeles waltl]
MSWSRGRTSKKVPIARHQRCCQKQKQPIPWHRNAPNAQRRKPHLWYNTICRLQDIHRRQGAIRLRHGTPVDVKALINVVALHIVKVNAGCSPSSKAHTASKHITPLVQLELPALTSRTQPVSQSRNK